MLFSLVFATRKRVDLLNDLFHSVAVNTSRHELVEIYPVYDDDDNETHSAVTQLTDKYPQLNLVFTRRSRSKRLNEDYINYAARMSSGKYVFVLNDDTLIETRNWDVVAERDLEAYLADKPDRVAYGMTDDSMDSLRVKQKMMYSGFPILTRESVNAVGFAMPPGYNSWGADIYLYDLYNSVSRICNLRSVRVLHVSHHVVNRQKDETAKNVEAINNDGRAGETIGNDSAKLAAAIGVAPPNARTQLEPPNVRPSSPPRKNRSGSSGSGFKRPPQFAEPPREQTPTPPVPQSRPVERNFAPPSSQAVKSMLRRIDAIKNRKLGQ